MDGFDTEQVRVNVFSPAIPTERDAVRRAFAAVQRRPTETDARGSVPLADVLLIGSVATHALAYMINTLRKSWSKGVVVDAMGRRLTIRQDPALPRGVVVVRSSSGEITVRDGAGLTDIITSALPQRGPDPSAAPDTPNVSEIDGQNRA
ncbi:hypothetical protein QJ054_33140 [Streptomyces sp. AN-3]|uniref:hypothetical protein n=1 Tax=Streptomyces sp. AN-3 TaxID=3044177 RepID=UPI002499D9E2|nr:hypothetical protein [Streptomyces sp. AN-3]MDI3101892.1 hypothetical protein [Streptomyces sp. AN-3]